MLPAHLPAAGALRFQPGEETRRFVAVPPGAGWAELRIRAGEVDTPKVRAGGGGCVCVCFS